ncbi:tail fiber domain-containing protein, partial [Paraburkholderia xenovorans]|uniref:tail fiber domain-containing protein n=1 Tax=Paraburkholderia xenovorans TaxID=36873 RepID=UPI001559C132
TLASKTGSGDSVALSKLNPGEAVLMDTDGVHAWTVLMRGRTNADDEVVNGNFSVSGNSTVNGDSTVNNSAVNGNETVGGTLGVTGAATLASATVAGQLAAKANTYFGSAAQASISAAGVYSGPSAGYSGNVGVGGTLGVTGLATLAGGVVTSSLMGGAATVVGSSASTLALYSNNTQRAMLDVNGSLHVNEAAAWSAAQLSVRNSATNTWGISAYCSAQVGGCFIGRTDSPSVPLAAWFFGTANVGTITTNGSTTAYGTGSDYRLKDGIEDLDGDFAVDLLMQGRPRKFWMRADPAKQVNYGFIAHEYAEIQPEAVVGEKDGMGPPMAPPVDDEGNAVDMPEEPRYQHMDYSKPTPILWAALKRAIERISALEAALARAG